MIYEYVCKKCGNEIEKFQTVRVELTILCSNCKSIMKRVISKSNFKCVGPGFYVNDYPKEENKSGEL